MQKSVCMCACMRAYEYARALARVCLCTQLWSHLYGVVSGHRVVACLDCFSQQRKCKRRHSPSRPEILTRSRHLTGDIKDCLTERGQQAPLELGVVMIENLAQGVTQRANNLCQRAVSK